MGGLVIVVTVEDRDGKTIDSAEFTDPQAADAAIARVRTRNPDALITRTEQEVS